MRVNGYTACIVAALALLAGQAASEPLQPVDERQSLLAQRKELEQRIAAEKTEQDILLLRKLLYQGDSKYLVLDLAAGTGTLNYRNRILKKFDLARAGGKGRPAKGLHVLSRKSDGSPRKRMLLFGSGMMLRSRDAAKITGEYRETVRYSVGKRDLAALYYALDAGSIAIVER